MQRAYREASRETMLANNDIIDGWIWHATLSARTCMACFAMHGTVHPLTEPMGTHPNFRCTQIPMTKSWEQLGISGVDEAAPDIKTGEEWLKDVRPKTAAKVMGQEAYDAWINGDVDLIDFVHTRLDPRWGVVRSERTLTDALRHHRAA